MSKLCITCNKLLVDKCFNVYNKTLASGEVKQYLTSSCKECNTLRCAERRKTMDGVITSIYHGQKLSSRKRGHPSPDYTKDELKDWLYRQKAPGFRGLYNTWVSSGHLKEFKPSCDRLDESKGYDLNNIRLVTWAENAKAYKDSKVLSGKGDCIAVDQLDLQGNLVKTYHSINEAARKTNSDICNIQRCCTGQYKTSKGFKWRYTCVK